MTDKLIKVGDLVTLQVGEFSTVSNTYKVERKLEAESLLSHPLAPGFLILKKDDELNSALGILQNDLEKCLSFAKKHDEYLGYSLKSDLDALCMYFVIKKNITSKQRNELSNMCGKVASVILNNNMQLALMKIRENKILLDDFNIALFNAYKEVIEDPLKIKDKSARYTIFNISGFILAQLQVS